MKNSIKEILPYIIILIVVISVKLFIASPVVVNGTSMNDTLKDGDVMILDKIGMKINGLKRLDIVVVRTKKSKIIKRVIGLPGETIECRDGKIYINDELLEEEYVKGETLDFSKVEIPSNMYFVMGDNRKVSMDSRSIGPVSKKDIMGYVKVIVFPFNRIGTR